MVTKLLNGVDVSGKVFCAYATTTTASVSSTARLPREIAYAADDEMSADTSPRGQKDQSAMILALGVHESSDPAPPPHFRLDTRGRLQRPRVVCILSTTAPHGIA